MPWLEGRPCWRGIVAWRHGSMVAQCDSMVNCTVRGWAIHKGRSLAEGKKKGTLSLKDRPAPASEWFSLKREAQQGKQLNHYQARLTSCAAAGGIICKNMHDSIVTAALYKSFAQSSFEKKEQVSRQTERGPCSVRGTCGVSIDALSCSNWWHSGTDLQKELHGTVVGTGSSRQSGCQGALKGLHIVECAEGSRLAPAKNWTSTTKIIRA